MNRGRPSAARAGTLEDEPVTEPDPSDDNQRERTTDRAEAQADRDAPSYGRVTSDGTPADPSSYDYTQSARDALHFAALFARFIQNLRRHCGYDLKYFAAIEPQKRLAPTSTSRSAAPSCARGAPWRGSRRPRRSRASR
jgi:hypothetical protein